MADAAALKKQEALKYLQLEIREKGAHNQAVADRFIQAGKQGDVDAMQCLLDGGVDVNTIHNRTCSTALVQAASQNRVPAVEFLLQQPGIDINIPTGTGDTALVKASMKGNLDIVHMLLQSGKLTEADINVRDNNAYGALQYAAMHGQHEVLQALLLNPQTLAVNTSGTKDLTKDAKVHEIIDAYDLAGPEGLQRLLKGEPVEAPAPDPAPAPEPELDEPKPGGRPGPQASQAGLAKGTASPARRTAQGRPAPKAKPGAKPGAAPVKPAAKVASPTTKSPGLSSTRAAKKMVPP
uniref:Ankyrin repeat domain-containing protein n=1 Tax=Eutreptiella gymnastica TaxID=73025 RepID=A0A7S4GEF4_9EUGL